MQYLSKVLHRHRNLGWPSLLSRDILLRFVMPRSVLGIRRVEKSGRFRQHFRIRRRHDRAAAICGRCAGAGPNLLPGFRRFRFRLAFGRISLHRLHPHHGSRVLIPAARLILLLWRALGAIPAVGDVDESGPGQSVAPVGVAADGKAAGKFSVEENCREKNFYLRLRIWKILIGKFLNWQKGISDSSCGRTEWSLTIQVHNPLGVTFYVHLPV